MIICPECLSERNRQVGYPDEDTITYVCLECGEVFDVDDYDPGCEDDYPDPTGLEEHPNPRGDYPENPDRWKEEIEARFPTKYGDDF